MSPTFTDLQRELRLSNSLRALGGMRAAAMPFRVHRGLSEPTLLRLRKHDMAVNLWVQDRSHLIAIEEVLGNDIYAEPPLQDPKLIVDLGSNIGASVMYFKTRYPDVEMVAVEADPASFDLLRKSTERLPGVTVYQAAVGVSGETVRFARSADSIGSSAVALDVGTDVIDVPRVQLDDLIAGREVDLLKIDIEGSEFEVLPAANLSTVRRIVGELHLGPNTTLDPDMAELLPGFDVRILDVYTDPPGVWSELRNFVAVQTQFAQA